MKFTVALNAAESAVVPATAPVTKGQNGPVIGRIDIRRANNGAIVGDVFIDDQFIGQEGAGEDWICFYWPGCEGSRLVDEPLVVEGRDA